MDFGGTTHYYAYDELNRMEGHGTTSNANDETYTWACCNRLTAYTDAQGTASLSYDDLARLTSHTDSNGNTVAYTYDDMSRIASITPASGVNHKTEYTYKLNGSLSKVRIYTAAATYEDTDYTYSTTSGKLTSRNFPTVSSQYIKTAYAYDSAGRLEYETTTRETGSTTNLYRNQYAYSYIAAGSGGGRQLVRTEQSWNGGGGVWDNANRTTYKWNALEWQNYEEREDYSGGSWSNRYDISQEYDKNGNRTRFHKNVAGGHTASYGQPMDLTYTYALRDKLTTITDADDANYTATVTCDANNNITQIDEQISGTQNNFLYTYYAYDALNRLTSHRTKAYKTAQTDWVWTKRVHVYDALGRVAGSTYKQWNNGGSEPAGDDLEHVWDQRGNTVQNYDGTTYGGVWNWAGNDPAPNTSHPLRSPNADTTAQTGYNASNNTTPQRRTYLNPTTEGNQRNLYGQGKPMAKDSSGSGANWDTGLTSQAQNGSMSNVVSRLSFEGTVTATDMSRATDAREKGRVGIFGTDLSYAGSYGRITSETIGRDLNPLGRGDGMAYVAGWLNLDELYPILPKGAAISGEGNSVNNFTLTCPTCGIFKNPTPQQGGGGNRQKIISRSGNHSMDKDCYDAWLAGWDSGLSEDCRRACSIGLNCPCGIMPEGDDWKKDPAKALDDYCSCVSQYSACEHECKLPNGYICTPPKDCIDCGNTPSCKCPPQCVDDAKQKLKTCILVLNAAIAAFLSLCLVRCLVLGFPAALICMLGCMVVAGALAIIGIFNCCARTMNHLSSCCPGVSQQDQCICIPNCQAFPPCQ